MKEASARAKCVTPTKDRMNVGSEFLQIPLMAATPDIDLAGQDAWRHHERDIKNGNPDGPSRLHNGTAEKNQIIYLLLSKAFRWMNNSFKAVSLLWLFTQLPVALCWVCVPLSVTSVTISAHNSVSVTCPCKTDWWDFLNKSSKPQEYLLNFYQNWR